MRPCFDAIMGSKAALCDSDAEGEDLIIHVTTFTIRVPKKDLEPPPQARRKIPKLRNKKLPKRDGDKDKNHGGKRDGDKDKNHGGKDKNDGCKDKNDGCKDENDGGKDAHEVLKAM